MSTFQTLRQLHKIIGESLSLLEKDFQSNGLDWPSLDASYTPGAAEAAVATASNVEAANRIIAAAEQLAVSVRRPSFTLFDVSMVYHVPACLRFAGENHVVEILRESGPGGLHIDELAAKCDQSTLKLGHALRLLATHHIFRELKPNVFANNRVSSVLDTGKPSAELRANPDNKFDGTTGLAAWIALVTDEGYKTSGYMTETWLDPRTKRSTLPDQTAFQRAFNTKTHYFPWHEEMGPARVKRFGIAMTGTTQWEAPDAVVHGFPWASLPEDSIVVDVGGGIGTSALKIAKVHPHLRMVIQDRPLVVANGEGFWKGELPQALAANRVTFQGHDFFDVQPCKNASVFMLRLITHNWSDEFVVKILKQLRAAAQPHTKLFIGDFILPYACVDDTDASNIPGAAKTFAPPPLLANLGRASAVSYFMDMTMQILFNAQERTLSHFATVLAEAGWKVTNVHRIGDSVFGHITAEVL